MDPSAVSAELRMHGLSLRSDAMRLVCDFLHSSMDAEQALAALLAALQSVNLVSCVVDAVAVRDALAHVAAGDLRLAAPDSQAQSSDSALRFVDAFAVPRAVFDPVRRAFQSASAPPRLLASPDAKVSVYRERFHLVAQRLDRSKLFSRPALSAAGGAAGGVSHGVELTPLQALLGTAGATRFVLGSLSLLDDGRYWLEDTTGAVAVDLTRAATAAGLFTENCVVVAEGELRRDGVFQVCALGFPPPERRQESLAALNGLDLFGAGSLRVGDVAGLDAAAAACVDEMWVLMSDVFLDRPDVLANLRRVFSAFDAAAVPPVLFVLMGDFGSLPAGAASPSLAGPRDAFEALATLLREFPTLQEHSQFVLMPGPGDPGPTPALPRPHLPQSLVRPLLAAHPNVVLASSPCRIRWNAQEVVLFREDLAGRMRGACVRPPVDDGFGAASEGEAVCGVAPVPPGERLFGHLCATLLQQSHLAPLPLPHAPVHWDFDHALWLYPAPHVLVLADRTAPQASAPFEDTTCFNPGSFGTDGSFAVYCPATRKVELSVVQS